MNLTANNIKAIRKNRNLTQSRLAKEIGISRSYLNDLEAGRKNPSVRTVGSIAKKLNVTVSDLMKGEEHTESLTRKIEQWATDRNLHTADPNKQMLKLIEEVGEIAAALSRGNTNETKDGIGDAIVVLTILAMQLNTSVDECMALAYNEIKDRKGRMVNGVFVKESDLQGAET